MTRSHISNDELTLIYFQEGGSAEREHLAKCGDCHARYEQLAGFLDALHSAPVPQKDPGWEQRLWAKIAPQVSEVLRPKPRFSFHPWLLAPVLAGLLIAAFLVGRYTQRPAPVAAFSAQARDRVFLITLGDHLDRSQIVLAELLNAPKGKPVNIADARQTADALVAENRLLRQTVAFHRDQSAEASNTAVLDQLERVLLDIAHAPSEVSPRELDDLRQRIEAQGLLFKVRVISSNAREKGMKL